MVEQVAGIAVAAELGVAMEKEVGEEEVRESLGGDGVASRRRSPTRHERSWACARFMCRRLEERATSYFFTFRDYCATALSTIVPAPRTHAIQLPKSCREPERRQLDTEMEEREEG